MIPFLQAGQISKSENMLLIAKANDSVTWKPDFEKNGNDWKKHFISLTTTVKDKFEKIRLKQTPMIYNPYNSVPCIDISLFDDFENVLSKDNIDKYWKLLENSTCVSVLKFSIDTDNIISDSKRAICISAHSNTNERKICSLLIKKDGKDIDWEKNYLDLLAMAGKMTNTKLEDSERKSEVKYDQMPYRIFKLKDSNALTKMQEELKKDEKYLDESHKFDDFYGLGDEMDDYGRFEDCYDTNNSVNGKYWVFLIQHKKALEIRDVNDAGSNKVFFWKPSKVEAIDWDLEFKQLKKQVCDHFNLQNNWKLSLKPIDTEEKVRNGNDIAILWGMFRVFLFSVAFGLFGVVFYFS